MKSCAFAARAAASISRQGGAWPAVGDVLADRTGEEVDLLRDDGDRGAQGGEAQVADVLAVDADRALLHVVEARDAASADRALPRAGAAHQRHHRTGGDATGEVGEDRRGGGIAEGDAVELDLPADGGWRLEIGDWRLTEHMPNLRFPISNLHSPAPPRPGRSCTAARAVE